MVLNENLELMVKRYVDGWDSETIVSLARELLAARKVVEAAREAAEGKGRYSRDQLTHADNCIEDMKGVLNAALAAYDAATKGE